MTVALPHVSPRVTPSGEATGRGVRCCACRPRTPRCRPTCRLLGLHGERGYEDQPLHEKGHSDGKREDGHAGDRGATLRAGPCDPACDEDAGYRAEKVLRAGVGHRILSFADYSSPAEATCRLPEHLPRYSRAESISSSRTHRGGSCAFGLSSQYVAHRVTHVLGYRSLSAKVQDLVDL